MSSLFGSPPERPFFAPRPQDSEQQGWRDPEAGFVRPHRGGMILVFGLLGLTVCVLFGVAAAIMGSEDLRQMGDGTMDRSGEGLTRAGQICGFIAIAVKLTLVTLAALAYFATA